MAYAESTKVPFERSISQILAMLRKHGADQVGQMESADRLAIQFTMADRMIRFTISLHNPELRRGEDQQRRQRARALLLVIKAKLESIENGIETIEQAFLANVVMADGHTVYDRIHEGIALEYESGHRQPFGLLEGPQQ